VLNFHLYDRSSRRDVAGIIKRSNHYAATHHWYFIFLLCAAYGYFLSQVNGQEYTPPSSSITISSDGNIGNGTANSWVSPEAGPGSNFQLDLSDSGATSDYYNKSIEQIHNVAQNAYSSAVSTRSISNWLENFGNFTLSGIITRDMANNEMISNINTNVGLGVSSLQAIQSSIAAQASDISNIASNTSSIKSDTSAIKSDVNQSKQIMTNIYGVLQPMSSDLHSINLSAIEVTPYISSIKSTVDNMDGTLTTIRQYVSNIDGKVEISRSVLTTIKGDTGAILDQVSSSSGKLDTIALNSDKAATQAQIANSKIDQANSKLTDLNGKADIANAKLDSIDSSSSAAAGSLSSIDSKLGTGLAQDSSVQQVLNQLTTMGGKLDNIDSNTTAAKDSLSNLDSNLIQTNVKLDNIAKDTKYLSASISNSVASIQGSATNIKTSSEQTRLNTGYINNAVQSMLPKMDTTNIHLTNIETYTSFLPGISTELSSLNTKVNDLATETTQQSNGIKIDGVKTAIIDLKNTEVQIYTALGTIAQSSEDTYGQVAAIQQSMPYVAKDSSLQEIKSAIQSLSMSPVITVSPVINNNVNVDTSALAKEATLTSVKNTTSSISDSLRGVAPDTADNSQAFLETSNQISQVQDTLLYVMVDPTFTPAGQITSLSSVRVVAPSVVNLIWQVPIYGHIYNVTLPAYTWAGKAYLDAFIKVLCFVIGVMLVIRTVRTI